MATYATLSDVAARWDGDELTPTQQALIATWLDEAEVIVRRHAGDLEARVLAETTTVEQIRLVLCAMVLRVARNPRGLTTQSVGPFSVNTNPELATGRLVLTREERHLLGLRSKTASMAMTDTTITEPHYNPCLDDVILPTP